MIYVDTSALAKWYMPEKGSDRFSRWMAIQEQTWVSTLTLVEMKSLLMRRVRDDDLTSEEAEEIWDTFVDDTHQGFLLVRPVDDSTMFGAVPILSRVRRQPLRTSDAIHLSVMADLGAPALATADDVLRKAGKELGFDVEWFGGVE